MSYRGRHLSEWFGYDRRERRATLVVFILIIILFTARYIVPGPADYPEISMLSDGVAGTELVGPVNSNDVKPPGGQKKGLPHLTIELNGADSTALSLLPGIGPVLSSRIVRYRALLGGYADKSQLLEVYGLREDVFNRLSGMVWTDTTLITRININTASYRTLLRHPYLDTGAVNTIVRYRDRRGLIMSWEEMESGGLLPPEKKDLLRYYFSFR